MRQAAQPFRQGKRAGISLVIVLFAVMCLSFLVVLFFSLASNDRSASAAFASGMKAEELGVGGLELVVGELRKEISDTQRSDVAPDPLDEGPTVYTPKEKEYIEPERTASDDWKNLLKVSAQNQPLFSGPTATLRGSSVSSATPSRNGRAVTAARWNRPLLAQFGSTPVPNWIYIGRQGPVDSPVMTAASDSRNAGFILGRIAFAIYDVGGLMDLNVAGYPSDVSAADAGDKGGVALARLQSLGLTTAQVEKLMSFRNPSTRAAFLNYLQDTDEHKGFTQTKPGDNRFVSRQELLRFAQREGFGDKSHLLTVFSREKNAPSFAPEDPDATNPNLASARHASSGRLIFEKRFPLQKLKLLAEPATNAAEIKQYFGLEYSSSSRSFTYTGRGNSGVNKIATLNEIAGEDDHRQPDFFETLKAVIKQGSLGISAGQAADTPRDEDADIQIMQIGANIIDQYDQDDSPTTINFVKSTVPIWGIENLPYVNKVGYMGEAVPAPPAVGGPNSNAGPSFWFRMAVELWNPHLKDASVRQARQIRVSLGPPGATGRVDIFKNSVGNDSSDQKLPGTDIQIGGYSVTVREDTTTTHADDWDDYRYFAEPTFVRLGRANDGALTPPSNPGDYKSALFSTSGFYVELGVMEGSVYRAYQRTYLIEDGLFSRDNPATLGGNMRGASVYIRSDPRTNRGGTIAANFRPQTASSPPYPSGAVPNYRAHWSIRRDRSTNGPGTTDSGPSQAYRPAGASSYFPGLLYENNQAATNMVDPDGETRIGDGGFVNVGPIPTQPIFNFYGYQYLGANPSRPTILNRPFRSVGELGYAFRDSPWKSLNLSSTDSADGGLLDVFTMDDTDVVAGKVNLNTKHPEVLAAVIAGSLREQGNASSALSEAQASTLANSITQFTAGTNKLLNAADIVRELSTTSILSASALGSSTAQAIKAQREAAVRALAGSVQTRTWNLMIDLIAQTGRFPTGATALDQFVVEGERRYWLHIAIDRYTGEIVDEQLELVQE